MSRPRVQLGLLGRGISASLTPALQEREGAAAGLNLSYQLLDADVVGYDVDDLGELLSWARRLGYDGLNVTHPFKQAVLGLLDEVSDDAADLGAVNTVIFRGARTLGRNTDWIGWSRGFRAVLPDALAEPAVVVGAGGAGAAVGYALLDQGAAQVHVVDTDADRALACSSRLAARFGPDRVTHAPDVEQALAVSAGLVNATPVGMVGHPGLPLAPALVEARLWVSDVVYFPLETELVRLARARGCRIVPGGGMAVGQAVAAFEHFTGRPADAERMARHFAELTGAPDAA